MDNHLGKVSQKWALGKSFLPPKGTASRSKLIPEDNEGSFTLTLPQGTLKHFPGTKNTALKVNTKLQNSAPGEGGVAP